ncbi:fatty acid synthase-like isoform X2 [Anoplophora glabripennis]|uniref:fatty acid synthase-like isoform X2 n=1 Tax=Anoplophora glabripennis TaxID=217634 RepID=UPI00087536C1|nr:fatty acid synthase-like isoform X2 [Anoplophora glabripennis]
MIETNTTIPEDAVGRKPLNYSSRGGHLISHPAAGEEVVITGVSGSFANSRNINEFKDNLFNKVNMLSPNQRWRFEHPEIPPISGTVPDIDKCDTGFFGLHERQSHSLNPLARLLLEKTVEAILDAGLNPTDLENTKTGVFVAVSASENSTPWFFGNLRSNSYAITGSERSMIAHRLSYFFKLKGPSYTIDSACSSSLYVLEHAYRAIRLGEIDNAIVCGTHLCLHPVMTMQTARLGVLSQKGCLRCFDADADGFVRSEAIVSTILQKSKCAKRAYAQLVHAKSNCDGYKVESITFSSGLSHMDMLKECYEECGVDRHSLSYVEAHETGTLVGGTQECYAIDEVLAKQRKRPLLVGSVKSNAGHAEGAAGLCSLVKCIIAMETGLIPANINFTSPRKDLTGIVEGRMKVVAEDTPLEDDSALMGISAFGFGGANCHVLIRRNANKKIDKGPPEDDALARLVCLSGRTAEAVTTILDEISSHEIDVEYIRLLHDGFRKNINNHLYRGYTIVSKSGEMNRSVKFYPGDLKPLYFVFGELHNWYEVGSQLMTLPIFSESIKRIQQQLSNNGTDIFETLLKKVPKKYIDPVIGNIVVQIGIIDVLKLLDMKPKDSIGFKFGILLSAYYKEILTLDETINLAVNNGKGTVNGRTYNKLNVDQDYNGSEAEKSLKIIDFPVLKDLASTDFEKEEYLDKFDLDSVVIAIGKVPVDPFEDFDTVSMFGNQTNHLVELLECLGRLYELGYNPQISRLYPSVDFPVSRGTRMVSPYVKWNHKRDRDVSQFDPKNNGANNYRIQVADQQWAYVTGHVINGKNLFPASGYLYIVWETFSFLKGMSMNTMDIVFENCKFVRATTVSEERDLVLQVAIHAGSGNFEVVEGDLTVATGRISILEDRGEDPSAIECRKTTDSEDFHVLLDEKDVYKELRLRGYNYMGEFRGIETCNSEVTECHIKWGHNWVTFLDNMIQIKILQLDTKSLYIPVHVSKLVIQAKRHLGMIDSDSAASDRVNTLPAFNDTVTGTMRCGGVSLTGLILESISKRKDISVPVLEKYTFVPNTAELDIQKSVRVNIQIIFENTLISKYKVIELIDEFTPKISVPLTPIIKLVSEDQPLIQQTFKEYTNYPLGADGDIGNKKLKTETDCLLVIVSTISERMDILEQSLAALKPNGFIISREPLDYDYSHFNHPSLVVVTVHRTLTETLVLLQKQGKVKNTNYVKINSNDFSWIPLVQVALRNNDDLILHAEKEHNNGMLGLVNCLRREPECSHLRCLYLMDEDKEFQSTHPFIAEQLKKNMAVNVYKNGQWGTYRFLPLNQQDTIEREHCFVDAISLGGLYQVKWTEGFLQHDTKIPSGRMLVHVYYAATIFKEGMIVSVKRRIVANGQKRLDQESAKGFEFSGRDVRGQRVMGVVASEAPSSLVLADPYLTFKIPDSWNMEEAATVPTAYVTLLYALLMRGQMKKGETILVHSGFGVFGQAAIRLCLYYNCTIYTTVNTKAERKFLISTFPQLKDNHIGYSLDESFEQMIHKETNGKGIDIVLSPFSKITIEASLRCLGKGGRFIEVDTSNISSSNHVNLLPFQKETSYHKVTVDQFMKEGDTVKTEVAGLFIKALQDGAVKPLSRIVFKYNEVEAFRSMTLSHSGKVLIKIREPEEEIVVVPTVQKFPVVSRYLCDPEKTYVILGGLGGFGLELANWLVLRGAQKLVLNSRKSISNGYQDRRIKVWRSYGAEVEISTAPATTRIGCRKLLEESLQLGRIGAIFNLAVVLQDSLFENQTQEKFSTSFAPKAIATAFLDELSRKMCPDLSEFVVFSSVSCGRGNVGQTNYGMANSVMERICEKRRQDGYPALAIEWGAIGEVGLVAEAMELEEVGGTLQQNISSCLQAIDTLLSQKETTIVTSFVPAEKLEVNTTRNISDIVTKTLGQNHIKSMNINSTLTELGIDSMTAAEIRQDLEKEFDIRLTVKEIGTMTISKLNEFQEGKRHTSHGP